MPKQFLSAISITTGRLTTLGVKLLPRRLPCLALLVAALAANAAFAVQLGTFSSSSGNAVPAPWKTIGLPERYAKPLTAIDVVEVDGKKVLRLQADKSWGTVAHTWSSDANTIEFQWRLDKALTKASFKDKSTEDAALKVCASFDMPADRIPGAERALFKLAQLFSNEKLPTATLCYVWANAETIDSIVASPTTARVRYMTLDNATSPLKTWKIHKRQLGADFLKAFGNESKVVPPVTAIIVGADSDNTMGSSLSYVSDISVQP